MILSEEARAILQFITATQNPAEQVRKDGERQLAAAQVQPTFITALFEALMSPEAASQSLSLSINLKQRVLHGWDRPNIVQSQPPISPEDKALIKAQLPVALAVPHLAYRARTQLRLAICEIIDKSGIQTWPELVPTALELIRSNDVNHVTSGIYCFVAVTRSYKLESDDDLRKNLDNIVLHAFPDLLRHAENLVNEQHESAIQLLLAIVKSYSATIFLELPVPLRTEQASESWCTLFVRIILQDRFPPDDWNEDMTKTAWGKVVKRAYNNLTRLYTRYGCPSTLQKSHRQDCLPFAEMFIHKFAPTILEQYFSQIKRHVDKSTWLAPVYLSSIITFLEKCISPKEMWKHIKDVLPELLAKFLYPLMCLSEDDLDMYSTDPKQYLFKRLDHEYLFPDSYAQDFAAANFILELVKQRTTGFTMVMNFIRDRLSPEYVSDPLLKEATFRLIGTIAPAVVRKPECFPSLDSFIVDVLLPDFQVPHGFLQARACHTVEQFKNLNLQWETRQRICASALACLQSTEIPVQAEAALVILSVLKHDEVQATIRPHVKDLIPMLIRLNQELVDIDGITSLIEDLIDFFPNEFIDIAESFTEDVLKISLQRVQDLIQSRSDEDPDSEENNIQTILTALQPLNTLLHNLKSVKNIIDSIGATILPLIAMVVHHKLEDLYNEVSSLAETCVFVTEAVTPNMWVAYNHLISLTTDGDTDVMIDLVPTLETYILYGDKAVISSPEFLEPLAYIVAQLLHANSGNTTETRGYVQFGSTGGSNEVNYGCRLAELLMLCARGRIDQYAEMFIRLAWEELVKVRDDIPNKGVPLLDIIIHAIYYDVRLAMTVLGPNMNDFLIAWFSNLPSLRTSCQKKVSIAALSFLLQHVPADLTSESSKPWLAILSTAAQLSRKLQEEGQDGAKKSMDLDKFLSADLGGMENTFSLTPDGEVGDDEDLVLSDDERLWGGNIDWEEDESQVEVLLTKLEPMPLLIHAMSTLSPQAQAEMARNLSAEDQQELQAAKHRVEEQVRLASVGAA